MDNIHVYNYTLEFDEDAVYKEDQVSTYVGVMQQVLELLGYNPGRTDGYFSIQTKNALEAFENDFDLPANGVLDKTTYNALMLENTRYYYMNEDLLMFVKDVIEQEIEACV